MEEEFRKDRFDIRQSTQESSRTPMPRVEDCGGDGIHVAKRRILVVEDEEPLRVLAGVFLLNAGYEVVDVCNAEDAIGILASEPFDLVFTDIGLKGKLTGIHLLRWVRTHRPQVPVILNSGQPLDREAGAGDVLFLQKPWRCSELLEAVAHELSSAVDRR